MDGTHQAPQVRATPIGPGHVGLSASLWYASFSVSLTVDQCRMLAMQLCTAADDAERQEQEAVQDAARACGVCSDG
jgi:hypothetical protein